jgi:hypothetical protein
MTIYNPLPIESTAIVYSTVVIFSTLLYIGYNWLNSYYNNTKNVNKKNLDKYFMIEIHLENIQNLFDEDNYNINFEQLSTNLMYAVDGVFALSNYNKLYIITERDENMDIPIDNDKLIEDIGIIIYEKISKCKNNVNIDNINFNLDISYQDIEKDKLSNVIKKVIRRNKIKFMKYLSKSLSVKILKKLPFTNKNMNTFYKKVTKKCGVNYLKSPEYAVCYKRINEKEAITFKSELRMFNSQELYDFVTDYEVNDSDIYDNPKMFDAHYVENELYDVYSNQSSSSSESSDETIESHTEQDKNDDNNNDDNIDKNDNTDNTNNTGEIVNDIKFKNLYIVKCELPETIKLDLQQIGTYTDSIERALLNTYITVQNIICNSDNQVDNNNIMSSIIFHIEGRKFQSHMSKVICKPIFIEITEDVLEKDEDDAKEDDEDMPPLSTVNTTQENNSGSEVEITEEDIDGIENID